MEPPTLAPRPWTAGRIVLTVLGCGLAGLGLLIVFYGIILIAQNPLLFIVGVPFAIFGALLVLAGLFLVAGSWLRARWRLRRARRSC